MLPETVVAVISRGGRGGAKGAGEAAQLVDSTSPLWTHELVQQASGARNVVIFVPAGELHPTVGRGAQLDELIPGGPVNLAIVPVNTHVTGVFAALQDTGYQTHRAALIASVRQHIAVSYAGAWVRRIGKLDHPGASVPQHLAGWNPLTRGYFATLTPTKDVVSKPPDIDSGTSTVRVQRTSSAPQERVQQKLDAAFQPTHRTILDPGHQVATRWATANALEYVLTPDPAALRLPNPIGTCPNCGDPVWGLCAFCHLVPSTPAPAAAEDASLVGAHATTDPPEAAAFEAFAPDPEVTQEHAAAPTEPARPLARLPRHRLADRAPTTQADNPWLGGPHSPGS